MAGLSKKNNNTRRLIIVFAAISVLLVVISTASLLYLNATMNRLSDSLYSDVYQNSELILNADRDLYQGAVSLHAALSPNITSEQRSLFAQNFEDNNTQIRQRLTMASYNINNLDSPYSGMKQSELLLNDLRNKLESFDSSFETWKETGRDLISRRVQTGWNQDSYSAALLNNQLMETRSSLDEAENLIDNYAQQITLEFREKKSALFAVYSLFLSLLILVIIYLCRRLISLQNQMLEEKSLYQLIRVEPCLTLLFLPIRTA